jgi:heat shock protein HslJ
MAASRSAPTATAAPRHDTRLDAERRAVLFDPQSTTALVGPIWQATSYNNGIAGVVTTVPGSEVSMVFSDDGRVSGNGGCNAFNGPYTLSGSSITFGPLATTRRACPSEAINLQEQRFLAALTASTNYEIAGDRLTLRDADRATQIIAVVS